MTEDTEEYNCGYKDCEQEGYHIHSYKVQTTNLYFVYALIMTIMAVVGFTAFILYIAGAFG